MGVFYGTLISTYIFYFIARISYDKKFRGLAIFWSLLVALILIFVSGLRKGIGDTPFYKHSYTLLPSSCNNKTSTLAPVCSFIPKRRAGITFELFLTNTSPSRK